MKRIVFLISLTLLTVYCTKEANYNEINENDEPVVETTAVGTKTVTFTATVENDPVTEGTVATDGAFTWSNTDEIAVWTSSQKRTATATNITGSSADFTFTLEESETISSGAIVVYPESLLTAAGTVTFPTTYTAEEAAKSNLALAAEVNGSSLSFKYLGAVIEATITDVPSIATAIEVTSSEALTGVHTVSFSEGIPSMATSSTAKTVTVTPLAGSNTIVLPLPTAANDANETTDQSITYTVKHDSDELFTKTASKDVDRSEYFKMRDLTIAPSVYVVGGMTDNWKVKDESAEVTNALQLTRDNVTYSTSHLSTLTDDVYFRLHLVFPSGYAADVQPADEVARLSGTFVSVGTTNAVPIAKKGIYSLSYNITTGAYALTKTSDTPIMYITNGWTTPFDFSLPMTSITSSNTKERYMYFGQLHSLEFKLYYNEAWGTAVGLKGGNLSNELDSSNLTVSGTADNVFTIFDVFNSSNATGHFAYQEGTVSSLSAASSSDIRLMGIGGDWDNGIALTKHPTYPKISYYDITGITSDTNITIKNFTTDTWYGYSNSAYLGDGAWDWGSYDNIGIWGSAGSPGSWRIIFNELTNKIHIYKTN